MDLLEKLGLNDLELDDNQKELLQKGVDEIVVSRLARETEKVKKQVVEPVVEEPEKKPQQPNPKKGSEISEEVLKGLESLKDEVKSLKTENTIKAIKLAAKDHNVDENILDVMLQTGDIEKLKDFDFSTIAQKKVDEEDEANGAFVTIPKTPKQPTKKEQEQLDAKKAETLRMLGKK